MSQERRSQGLCPLTPEETALVLQALGFERKTQIYIAAGEIYGGERRLAKLRAAFPGIVSSSLFWFSISCVYVGRVRFHKLVQCDCHNICWLSLLHHRFNSIVNTSKEMSCSFR